MTRTNRLPPAALMAGGFHSRRHLEDMERARARDGERDLDALRAALDAKAEKPAVDPFDQLDYVPAGEPEAGELTETLPMIKQIELERRASGVPIGTADESVEPLGEGTPARPGSDDRCGETFLFDAVASGLTACTAEAIMTDGQRARRRHEVAETEAALEVLRARREEREARTGTDTFDFGVETSKLFGGGR